MDFHIHANGAQLITFLAFWVVTHTLVQTVAARHPDNAMWQGAAYVF